jgi:hypothetical protein
VEDENAVTAARIAMIRIDGIFLAYIWVLPGSFWVSST